MAQKGKKSDVVPPLRHEIQNYAGQRWPLLIAYLVTALILAVAIVFGTRWVYRDAIKSTPQTVKPAPASAKDLPRAPATPGSGGPTPVNNSQAKPAAPPSAPLPNTGG